MNNIVVIPTAGLGSRMGDLSKSLNKSLLPYKNKPVISHIIDQFPKNTRYIILVGYNSSQVIDFCSLTYKDRNIEFVKVDDYTSNKAGPSYSFKHCIDRIDGSFWYIPCDTYFNESLTNRIRNENTYFVTNVDKKISDQYTMFDIIDDRIKYMKFKKSTDDSWLAFTGVMYIYDWKNFIDRIKINTSPEIIWAISLGEKVERLDTWLDFGNYEIYNKELLESQKYVFSKVDEITYIVNDRVVKWWNDSSISNKKYQRYLQNQIVFPDNVEVKGNYLAYDYFKGSILYNVLTPKIFNEMLEWLDNHVWISHKDDITSLCENFYKVKTFDRISKFLSKYPSLPLVDKINGVSVKSYEYYLNSIDWDFLKNESLSGFIHGDLHFDNSVFKDGEFRIIDWRPEFDKSVESGDIYYDLAKMLGGFIINYSRIKENEFNYEINGTEVLLEIPSINQLDYYTSTLKNFIRNKGWNYKKVKLLVPIIFWNMSPLHTPNFDLFLWYLGIKLFQEIDNENENTISL